MVDETSIYDPKCSNKVTRMFFFQSRKIINLRGFYLLYYYYYFNSLIDKINWKKAWLLPYKFCVPSRVKEVHLKKNCIG